MGGLTSSPISWCEHDVQAPNYTHVWEEEQKEDGPTCGLMDGCLLVIRLEIKQAEHLIIRVSLRILLLAI